MKKFFIVMSFLSVHTPFFAMLEQVEPQKEKKEVILNIQELQHKEQKNHTIPNVNSNELQNKIKKLEPKLEQSEEIFSTKHRDEARKILDRTFAAAAVVCIVVCLATIAVSIGIPLGLASRNNNSTMNTTF